MNNQFHIHFFEHDAESDTYLLSVLDASDQSVASIVIDNASARVLVEARASAAIALIPRCANILMFAAKLLEVLNLAFKPEHNTYADIFENQPHGILVVF